MFFSLGGLVLFGICSLIMDVFKIANYIGYLHCDSAVKIAFPVVQAVFILVQVRTQVLTSQMELPIGDITLRKPLRDLVGGKNASIGDHCIFFRHTSSGSTLKTVYNYNGT